MERGSSVPYVLSGAGTAMDQVDTVGQVLDLLSWFISGGSAVQSDCKVTYNKKVYVLSIAMLSALLVVSLLMMAIDLYCGSMSNLYFLISFTNMSALAALLAFAHRVRLNPGRYLDGGAHSIVDDKTVWNASAILPCKHSKLAVLAFFCFALHVLKLVYLLHFSTPGTGHVDLVFCGLFFSMMAAIPFWSVDNTPSQQRMSLGWKLYSLEISDILTMMLGFIQYSAPGMRVKKLHQMIALFFGMACAASVLVFGFLSAILFGIIFARSAFCDQKSAPLMSTQIYGTGSSIVYQCICKILLILDLATDVPALILTIFCGAYRHNFGLTMNLIFNLMAILRVVYIAVFCLDLPLVAELSKKMSKRMSRSDSGVKTLSTTPLLE